MNFGYDFGYEASKFPAANWQSIQPGFWNETGFHFLRETQIFVCPAFLDYVKSVPHISLHLLAYSVAHTDHKCF